MGGVGGAGTPAHELTAQQPPRAVCCWEASSTHVPEGRKSRFLPPTRRTGVVPCTEHDGLAPCARTRAYTLLPALRLGRVDGTRVTATDSEGE